MPGEITCTCGISDHLDWCALGEKPLVHHKLQQQPSKWSCIPTAFAMVIDRPVAEAILWCGRDDERGFHPVEMCAWALTHNVAFVPIDVDPVIMASDGLETRGFFKVPPISYYLGTHDAVLIGTSEHMGDGQSHAVAWFWQEQLIYDPMYATYGLEHFTVDVAWLATRI